MKANTDYKEKIRKILALAESPNEHEAKAAMLKARQLMAEHKLTEADLKDFEKQEVKDILTDITCSKRRNPWVVRLSTVIGENYCCKGYMESGYGEQTKHIGFIGFEDDVEICAAIFKYAVDCVLAELKRIKRANACYYSSYQKKLCESYGYGFTVGVEVAFRKQQKENEQDWGLVLITPKEVEETAKDWDEVNFSARSPDNISGEAFERGFLQGKEFDPTKRLQEGE